jgi:hypothetical protein
LLGVERNSGAQDKSQDTDRCFKLCFHSWMF